MALPAARLTRLAATTVVAVTTVVLVAPVAAAQQQTPIPIRKVTTLASTDSGVIANVYVIHAQSDGSVLLNDAARRRLLLFDSTLKKYKIVADTAGESPNNFGNGSGGLLFSRATRRHLLTGHHRRW